MDRARLDPQDYVVIPDVPVVDEFTLVEPADDGGFTTFRITKEFLEKCCLNGNRREAETNDLCPIVIGKHTDKLAREEDQPEIVGYARNWHTGQLFDTGRLAAKADFWIKKPDVNRVSKYPRRSAEIWRARAEIDPISLLGATTPHRDLGMLPIALDRKEDRISYQSEGELNMPAEEKKDDKKKVDDTPSMADLLAKVNELAAAVSKLQEGAGGGGNPGSPEVPGNPAATPNTPGEPAGEGEMSDEELEKLIKELESESNNPAPGRKEDEPLKTMGYPGGQNTMVPNERVTKLERQVGELLSEITRRDLSHTLDALKAKGWKPTDEDFKAEVADLLALPDDMRKARLSRLERMIPQAPITDGPLDALTNSATSGGQMRTDEDKMKVVKLARDENLTFPQAYFKTYGKYPGM